MQASRAAPSVVRLVVLNWILGIGAGILAAALLLWLDIAGLRTLLVRDGSVVGLVLLFGGFAVTFGSVVCGTAIMAVRPEPESDWDAGGSAALEPAAARVRQPRRTS